MIDHITLCVRDIEKSRIFYDEPFGRYEIDVDPIFAIVQQDSSNPAKPNLHVAFKVESRETFKEFYYKALDLGGKNNTPRVPRPHYGDSYYAAFILDFDRNNMEVCLY